MLTLPLLGTLTTEDLNQRYGGTYILYDQKARYCTGFEKSAMRGCRHVIEVSEEVPEGSGIFGERKILPFDWNKLDITRPLTGYYAHGRNVVFVTHTTNRQYHRGLSAGNTNVRVVNAIRGFEERSCYFSLVRSTLNVNRNAPPKKTTKEIDAQLNKPGNYCILSRQVAIVGNEVFLGLTLIGAYSLGVFHLYKHYYNDELRDRVVDYLVELVPKTPVKKSQLAGLRFIGNLPNIPRNPANLENRLDELLVPIGPDMEVDIVEALPPRRQADRR